MTLMEFRLQHLEEKLDRILCQLHILREIGEKLMSAADDFKASLAKLDTETTAVGALVSALAAKIHNGMTDQEVADIKAGFTALDTRLQTLAVDPTDPVPPAPPALQALRKKL